MTNPIQNTSFKDIAHLPSSYRTKEKKTWLSLLKRLLDDQPIQTNGPLQERAQQLSTEYHRRVRRTSHVVSNFITKKTILQNEAALLHHSLQYDEMLCCIPTYQRKAFSLALHQLYHRFLLEDRKEEEAYGRALAHVLCKSFIDPDELDDEKLIPYRCAITQELILFKTPVYIQQGGGEIFHRYQEHALREWLRKSGTNPTTRLPCRLSDISYDEEGQRQVTDLVSSLLYSTDDETSSDASPPPPLLAPLIAASLGYPAAYKAYEKALPTQGSLIASQEAETLLVKIILATQPLITDIPGNFFAEFVREKEDDSFPFSQPLDFSPILPPPSQEEGEMSSWPNCYPFLTEFLSERLDDLLPLEEEQAKTLLQERYEAFTSHVHGLNPYDPDRNDFLKLAIKGELTKKRSAYREEDNDTAPIKRRNLGS